MTGRHTNARMRGLATELAALRMNAGLNTRDAARLAGTSPASLNRMENGGKTITPEDVATLLVAYGVTGLERERLLEMAREPALPAWWPVGRGMLPAQLRSLIQFESQASRIVDASMLLIPGLLQTADYARAVLRSAGITGVETETIVAARLGRQAVLSKDRPARYLAVLDEAVLRRPLGGPGVMAEQVRTILAWVRRPHLDVRVIPFAHGGHAGLDGAYLLLDFPAAQSVVYLEHKRFSAFLDDPEEVAPFQLATDTLLSSALGPADSVRFLTSVAEDLARG